MSKKNENKKIILPVKSLKFTKQVIEKSSSERKVFIDNTSEIIEKYQDQGFKVARFSKAKYIKSCAFEECSNLVMLVIPLVTTIEEGAFKGCTSLTMIRMGKVNNIAMNVFDSCSNLTSIYVTDKSQCEEIYYTVLSRKNRKDFKKGKLNIYYGDTKYVVESFEKGIVPEDGIIEDNKKIEISKREYEKNNKLKDCRFEKVRRVKSYAFYICSSLEKVNMPLVKVIEKEAFYGCKTLSEICIPSVKYIKNKAFSECRILKKVDISSVEFIENEAFAVSMLFDEIDMPKVKSIGDGAFFACTALKTVNMPSIINIGKGVFNRCESLSTIKVNTEEQCKKVYDSFTFENQQRYEEGKLNILYNNILYNNKGILTTYSNK